MKYDLLVITLQARIVFVHVASQCQLEGPIPLFVTMWFVQLSNLYDSLRIMVCLL